jgi:hypothetical protein
MRTRNTFPQRLLSNSLIMSKHLRGFCVDVRTVKAALVNLTDGGHPVVYAIRVEPIWFGKDWATYICEWEEGRASTFCVVPPIGSVRTASSRK